jgi:4-carboxymuconolactone decarboxylase
MAESPMRLAPLPDDRWDDRVRESLAVLVPEHRLNPRGAGTALATLVRHPDLTEAFLTFSKHLMLGSTLPPLLRELAILRIAKRRDCAYEWLHHVKWAARMGLSAAEIEAAGDGKATGELEAAVLTAVDELDVDSRLSDATWATLCEHLDERQRMDLVFTIGGYCLSAMAFNALGIEPEHKG